MAIRRSQNWVNQQRVDVPHLRSIESAVRNDFDELINSFITGESQSYIIRGFEIDMGNISAAAHGLLMNVENSAIFHGKSTESGTFFQVPIGTDPEELNAAANDKVDGTFIANSINYIGLELVRQIDSSTDAQIFLWNPTSNTEISKVIPLAEILDYQIKITPSLWAENVIPIAIVETDIENNASVIHDRRPMLFRLGTAGSAMPDPFHNYPWTNHSDDPIADQDKDPWEIESRIENPYKSSTVSPFRGGDKQFLHFKEWADGVMSAIKEIKGTPYWYSYGKSGSLLKLRGDLANTYMTGGGYFIHHPEVDGQLNWDSRIYLNFIGSRLKYTIETNPSSALAQLNDDQVLYVKLIRDRLVYPKVTIIKEGGGITSVKAVSDYPWTGDLHSGDYIKLYENDDTKYYEVATVRDEWEVTLVEYDGEEYTDNDGVKIVYAYGHYGLDSIVYPEGAVPEAVLIEDEKRRLVIVDRKDVPFEEDVYWLAWRDGSSEKIYLRNSTELEQGEVRQISDNVNQNQLDFIGAESEAQTNPPYLYVPEAPQILKFSNEDNLTIATSVNAENTNILAKTVFDPYREEIVFTEVVPVDTNIEIPLDSKNGEPRLYMVGANNLSIYLRGQKLRVNSDYEEVGSKFSFSNAIKILQPLRDEDVLEFTMPMFEELFPLSAVEAPESPFNISITNQDDLDTLLIGSPYNVGTDKLDVYRNGVLMVKDNLSVSLVSRYSEVDQDSIYISKNSEVSDVFSFINESYAPNFKLNFVGFSGTKINLPPYAIGTGSLRVFRNGILMNTSGNSGAILQYSESTPYLPNYWIDLAAPAVLTDVFTVIEKSVTPEFREEITGVTGTTINLSNAYTMGDELLLVFRNGVLMQNSTTLGNADNRYLEDTATSITLELAAVATDVFTFIYK